MMVLQVDGIGSAAVPAGEGILAGLATLVGERVRGDVLKVPWPASMAGVGGNLSWTAATSVGVRALDELANTRPDDELVVLGYSGGCRVVREWLEACPYQHRRVLAVGMLSDPYRPRGRWQHASPVPLADPGGWGICGEKLGPLPDRTYWSSAPGDVISSCPGDSPLRTFADVSDAIPGGLLYDLRGHLKRSDWQLANEMKLWRRDPLAYLFGLGPRLDRARRDVEGYLSGAHTLAYVRPFADGDPLSARLAATVAYRANKYRSSSA